MSREHLNTIAKEEEMLFCGGNQTEDFGAWLKLQGQEAQVETLELLFRPGPL